MPLVPPLGRRLRGRLGAGVPVALAQGGDLILEVGKRLEPSVDRGEPEVGHLVHVDRPSLTRALHAANDLVPGERLGDAAALGHHQDDRLLGGEPPPALRARPAATDRGAVVSRPAVDDPAVRVATERAIHAITSLAAVRVHLSVYL